MERETSAVPDAETPEQRTRRQLATLREISDLALRLARKVAEEATNSPPEPAGKPNRNGPRQHFERLAKFLRETIALENRIASAARAPAAAPKPPVANPNRELDDLSAIGRLYKSPTTSGAKNPWRK